jgi:MinD-like ATPase involved in chromosome partitioning or flagellar assembly
VTPDEHDNPMTISEPAEGDAPAGAVGGQPDDYLAAGENPFASAYPPAYQPGTGVFRQFPVPQDEPDPGGFPRDEPPRGDSAWNEFPRDDVPADLPVMEPLPDSDALPDPGFLGMTGYQPSAAPPPSPVPPPVQPSAFPPPPAFPPPAPPSAAAGWPPVPAADQLPAFPPRYEQGDPYPPDAYRERPEDAYPERPAGRYRDWPPEDQEQPGGAYTDPYQAPRAPGEAPPLRGPAVPLAEIQAPSRPAGAPPLAAAQPAPPFPAAPPAPLPAAAWDAEATGGEPLGAPPSLEEQPVAEPLPRETADSLTTDLLLSGKRAAPGVGWRAAIYRASGGLIRVGESAADLRHHDLVNRVRTPVAGGHHRVAVMSLKGGVGKTTAAVALGSTLASLRGDRVIAVDGNPDRGTLSDKVRLETSATIRDLLNERAQVSRYADVRAFTSQASSRLEILASDRDPGVSVAFSADDYRAVVRVLEHYYSICITDCGTGLLHSAMAGILELADQIVLVSSPSVDGARSASATLDWLEAHSYGDLARNGVVVLSMIRRKSKSTVDLDRLEAHFAARCRAVVRVPYDPHLEEGAEVELDLLNSETADAYLALAALVGDGFAVPRHPVSWLTSAAPFA